MLQERQVQTWVNRKADLGGVMAAFIVGMLFGALAETTVICIVTVIREDRHGWHGMDDGDDG